MNEYRVRLIADNRSDVNPDGLWIAEYSERPIDGERRDRILNAPDATRTASGRIREANDGSRTREGHGDTQPTTHLSRGVRAGLASRPKKSLDTFSPKKDRRLRSRSSVRKWPPRARL